jgi:putative tryptophan/tyrosine transport system substrate-binding protein
VRRRAAVLLGLFAILFAGGGTTFAQTANKVYRLGVLAPGAGPVERMQRTTFPELARLGFAEGANLAIEARLGPREQLAALAHQIAETHPDAVIAVSAAAIRAMHQAAPATPIVGAFIGEDPIAAGFAQSLAHPGSTITGIVMLAPELDAKRLYLLHEAVPDGRRIAVLAVNAQRDDPNLSAVKEAAKRAGVELLVFYGAQPEDYPATFAAMRKADADALEIISAPELYTDASTLAALARDTGLPTMCEWAEMARSGCLLGYGPDYTELQNRVANFVAQIFRGSSPSDLPMEGPTHYQFTVNINTAKALGLTVPQSILARADEVIE